jgi:hypothetical protein
MNHPFLEGWFSYKTLTKVIFSHIVFLHIRALQSNVK